MGVHIAPAPHLTVEAKDELCRSYTSAASVRRAEVVAILRFSKSLHDVKGQTVLRAEVDPSAVAQRLRRDIYEVFGCSTSMSTIAAGAHRKHASFVVQVGAGAARLARQTGLLDKVGNPVQGLPAAVIASDVTTAAAVWRGAFLAAGHLPEPGRSAAVEITCPGLQTALALINAARRCGVTARHRERRGKIITVIDDPDDAVALLTAMGAPEVAGIWRHRWQRRQERITAANGTNSADANVRRAVYAGVVVAARCRRALEILATEAPEHLRVAGELRVENQRASLDELGKMYDPPLSKDAVAGRIRRLLTLADRSARASGVADTGSAAAVDLAMAGCGQGHLAAVAAGETVGVTQ